MSVPSPVAALARVMLALMFVMAGASKFANLEGTAGYIASGGLPMPAVLAVLAVIAAVSAVLVRDCHAGPARVRSPRTAP